MASIINKISFNNFFNYFGDFDDPSTTYELEKGLNIIVADNGAGKSKFFNAFLWLFNDQILDSDDKFIKNVNDVFVKILSDKAKNETPIRESVRCGIMIEYTSGDRVKYQIIKSFTATRQGDEISNPSSWLFSINQTEVNRTELVLPRFRPVYDEDRKQEIIDSLISSAFRRYSFLQGEEVDKIIDFGKKESIEEAVQNLTDIKKYESLVEIVKYVNEKAFKDLNTETKTNKETEERLQNAIEERERVTNEVQKESAVLAQHQQTFQDAERERDELDKNYANAEKRKELDDKLKPLNARLKDKKEEFENFLDRLNNRFFDGNSAWIAMGFETEIERYRKMNEDFLDKHHEKKALKNIEDSPNSYFHFLPVDSPDAVSIMGMIENEHCYVCDRPAKKGKPEYEYLLKLLDRPGDSIIETEFVANDLKNFFGQLQIGGQSFYKKIPFIRSSVTTVKQRENELKDQINKLDVQIKTIKNRRKDIEIVGSDEENTSSEIVSRYKGAIQRMETSRSRIDDILIPRIDKLKSALKKINDTIKDINIAQDIPQGYKDNYTISTDLLVAAENAQNRVFDEMITKLETHANIHFKELIKKNSLAGGILRFDRSPSGAINFNYVDSQGNNVPGGSEGFQRMKKFSVVMAIISANTTKYNYPLLADAPLSAFGLGFAEGFLVGAGEVFPQSIVLVKELYDPDDEEMHLTELGKKLVKEPYVKSFYLNQVPEDCEQIDLVTTKIRYK